MICVVFNRLVQMLQFGTIESSENMTRKLVSLVDLNIYVLEEKKGYMYKYFISEEEE